MALEVSDVWTNLSVIGAALAAGAVAYWRRQKQTAMHGGRDPVLDGVALGFIEREQFERLIEQVTRIGNIMADKNTATVNDKLDELMEKMSGMEADKSENTSRRTPARRKVRG